MKAEGTVKMNTLHYEQYTLEIFGADNGWTPTGHMNTRPVVWIPTFEGEGENIWNALANLPVSDPAWGPDGTAAPEQLKNHCTLICVSGMNWNRQLSPWPSEDFGGEASAFLQILLERLLPLAENTLPFPVTDRGIAGYSLAGLFALYTLYQTPLFHRIGSVSGSLWFENFTDYAMSHQVIPLHPVIYLSLGSKEHRTPHPRMRTVKENTLRLTEFLQKQYPLVYETNPGGHFTNPAGRMAKAIDTLLSLHPQ